MSQTLADQTLYHPNATETNAAVVVCQICWALHPIADQSVPSMTTVRWTAPASVESVKTHVLVCVASMRIAVSAIIYLSASAIEIIKEIPFLSVILLQVSVSFILAKDFINKMKNQKLNFSLLP